MYLVIVFYVNSSGEVADNYDNGTRFNDNSNFHISSFKVYKFI